MEEEQQGASAVQRLPGELTLFIFSFVDFGALCSASLVCREWHSLSCERALWLNLLAKSLTRLKNTRHESHVVREQNNDKQKQIKGLVRTSEGQVISGSVECLIDEAIHTHRELFGQQFLNTCPTFITRSALLLQLLRRYDASLLPFSSDNDDEEKEGEEEASVNIRLREGEQFLSAEQLREEHEQRAKKAKEEAEEGEVEDESFSELWRKTNICRLLAQWCSSFALEDFINCTENTSEKADTSEEEDEKGTGKERQEEEEAENEIVLALKIFVRGMVLRDFSSLLSNREEQTRLNNNHKKKEEDGQKHVKEQQQQDEKKKGKKRSKFGALFGRKTQKEKEKERAEETEEPEVKGYAVSKRSLREEALQSVQSMIASLRCMEEARKGNEKERNEVYGANGELNSEWVVQSLLTTIELEHCPAILPLELTDALEWSNIPAVELARQITLLHHFLFSRITRRDLLSNAWQNNTEQKTCIRTLISHFNSIANWVTLSILQPTKLSQRCKVINYFRDVITELERLGNYNALMAIVAGYNSTPVYRLKQTLERCPQRTIEVYNTFGNYLSSSHRQLRQATEQRAPPLIPYLGTYLVDLVFINDGNSETTAEGLINFQKRALQSSIISFLRRFQLHPFHLRPIPQVIHFLLHLPFLSDQECYALSLEREPRKK
ncbi:hypothetical protein QOT17_020906 [Balamuthia mandrillaris]